MSNKQDDKPSVITETIPDDPRRVVREDQGSKALFRQAKAAEAAKPTPTPAKK